MPPPTLVFGYVPDSQTRFNFPLKIGCSPTPGHEIKPHFSVWQRK